MPWSSNKFTRIHSWSADAAAGIDILASRMDDDTDDIAAGINSCINKDGLNSPTADLNMGGRRHFSVADAYALDQYATAFQVQKGQLNWGGTSTGSGNVYALSNVGGIGSTTTSTGDPLMSPSPIPGTTIYFTINHTNDGAATLSINDPTITRPILYNGNALTGGELAAGALGAMVYNGTGWQIITPAEGSTPADFFYPFGAKIGKLAPQDFALGSTGSSVTETIAFGSSDAAEWDDGIAGGQPFWGGGTDIEIPPGPVGGDGRYRVEANLIWQQDAGNRNYEGYFQVDFNGGSANVDYYSGGAQTYLNNPGTIVLPAVRPALEYEFLVGDKIRVRAKLTNQQVGEAPGAIATLLGGGLKQNSSWFSIRKVG